MVNVMTTMPSSSKSQINQNCSDFPVQSYIVQLYNVLQDSTLTVKCQANTNNCSAEKIIIHAWDGLQQNMKYVYNITAVNVYGSTTTSPQTLCKEFVYNKAFLLGNRC